MQKECYFPEATSHLNGPFLRKPERVKSICHSHQRILGGSKEQKRNWKISKRKKQQNEKLCC